MSRALITDGYLTDIADAIRAKLGVQDTYTPPQMAAAIENIPTGITPTGTKQINQNGTHDVTQYASADVNVPNSYAAGDEGRVVSNGALVAQTSRSVAANGTYDTTTNDEVVVSVQPNLQSKTVTQNGTVTPDQGYDGLSSVSVRVPGGGGSSGVYVGTEAPNASVGSDGDYYYQRIPTETGYSSTPGAISATTLSGYEFTANSAATVIGLLGYVRNATTGSLILAASDGTIIKQIDNISFVAGWNCAEFAEPVQLVANTNYIVMISVNNAYLSCQSIGKAGFSALITGVQGRYGSLPGTVDTKNIYSADVAFESPYIVQKQYFKTSGTWGQIA